MAGACDGKVALVTGASRGLGKAIAQRLAGEGATVGLTARTIAVQQTHDEITNHADLSKSEERERIFGELAEKVGKSDILVNNAAVYLP
jgi:citronellol/citronellal dehydrogenase